ncbi:MAG: hypothetical protein ABI556_09945 [Gemmatimonadales bacterium]
MIPAVLFCAIVSACADQQPLGPELQSTDAKAQSSTDVERFTRLDNVQFNEFFLAWSRNYVSAPIQTQIFAVDTRQDRQFAGLYPDESVLAFARAYPGHLYINGDEPDQYCFDPYEYAGIYRAFVTAVRGADPTARVSPAGFAEPNDKCCPEPVEEPCRVRQHSINFAQQFYDSYIRRFGSPPRVDEWRFHDFGVSFAAGDMNGWWARVDREAAWAVAHGANMVLGGWGFHGWREPVPVFQEHMKQAIGRLMNDNRINGAVYWSYEPWIESPRPLANDDGTLTAEGQTYANPLTDVPTAVKIVGAGNGLTKLRWSNTTLAWPAEVEFFVQTPGSSSFVYQKTQLVTGAGAKETPFVALTVGTNVKARVRYYNAFGQASWSPFSNIVSLSSLQQQADPGKKASPQFCSLKLC